MNLTLNKNRFKENMRRIMSKKYNQRGLGWLVHTLDFFVIKFMEIGHSTNKVKNEF